MKRDFNNIEIETQYSESFKRIRFQSDSVNNFGVNNNNNNVCTYQNSSNNSINSTKIWSSKYILDEQKLNQLSCCNYGNSDLSITTNINTDTKSTFEIMTPISTPPNQIVPTASICINSGNRTFQLDPDCEVEEYMLRGYENFNQGMTSIQYGLYDMTQEELAMLTSNNNNEDNAIDKFNNLELDIEMT